jgi:ABC-type multidrug transport system fused ATPase/permease subunit
MSEQDFTREERADSVAGSITLLWRYVCAIKPLRWLLLPNLVAAAVTCSAYLTLLWLAGKLAECEHSPACIVTNRWLPSGFTVSLSLLAAIVLFVVCARSVQWILFESGSQFASIGLFRQLVRGLAHVRTTYFDQYPSGKIINRIVGDFEGLRFMGPIRIGDSCSALVELVIAACLIALVSPAAALVAIPVLAYFLFVQRNLAPMLQRTLSLRSVRFGEVLHRGTDLIEGARTYVLYQQPEVPLRRLRAAAERYMQMHFLRGQVEAWGRVWSELVISAYISLAMAALFLALRQGALSVVMALVVITTLFRLSGIFGWLSWSLGYLFESAGHARRVFEYVDLPDEASQERASPVLAVGSVLAGAKSPGKHDLEIVAYRMSYRLDSPVVLDDIDLTITAGSKLGLVGRTGAGKSSLVQALYRMVYVHQGDIRIGGTSLFSLPISQARSFLSIVPQDPYLFEGSVRSNLDRYNELPEATLKDALQAAQFPYPLDLHLLEGGHNLSLGERQLLCLARVILSARPIIIMDEPTSGIDSLTDAAIQELLRGRLADRTVITIAHRLETLRRVERIIELRAGKVVRDGPRDQILPSVGLQDLA